MRVICTTSPDLADEVWPDELPVVPRIGDEIQSATRWKQPNGGYFRLDLPVTGVRWVCSRDAEGVSNWVPEILLDSGCNLKVFYQWYAPLVGKTVESFL